MQVVILSPHCDDAPLSLGAALLERRLGQRPTVHVVFSRSAFTLTNQSTAWQEVTTLRKAEERLAAQLAAYAPTFWDLPEALLRSGSDTIADVFDTTRDTHSDLIYADLAAAIEHMLSCPPELVLSPLGCGNHFDHRLVRDAAIECCDRCGLSERLGFYEDLPYAGTLSLSEIQARAAGLSPELTAVSLRNESVKAKNTLLSCYQSQLTGRTLALVKSHAVRVQGERLWIPRHWGGDVLACPDIDPKAALRSANTWS